MAAEYDVVSSEQVTVVLSPTQVMEMTRFGISTKPSGVMFYVNVPVKNVTAAAAKVTLQRYALLVEAAMRLEGVVAGRGEQDVDGSGLLADYVVFTVEYDPENPALVGPYQRDVRVLTRNLSSDVAFKQYVGDPVAGALAFLRNVVGE